MSEEVKMANHRLPPPKRFLTIWITLQAFITTSTFASLESTSKLRIQRETPKPLFPKDSNDNVLEPRISTDLNDDHDVWFTRLHNGGGALNVSFVEDDRVYPKNEVGALNSSFVEDDRLFIWNKALKVQYTVQQTESWGGFVDFGRILDEGSFNCAGATDISIWYKVIQAQSSKGRAHLRLIMLDDSDCKLGNSCKDSPGINLEHYYSFHNVLDGGNNKDNWKELRVKLEGDDNSGSPLHRTGWVGQVGNNQLDAASLRGWRIEFSIDSQGGVNSTSSGVIMLDHFSCLDGGSMLSSNTKFVNEPDIQFVEVSTNFKRIEFQANQCYEECALSSECRYGFRNGNHCFLASHLGVGDVELIKTEFAQNSMTAFWKESDRGDFCQQCECREEDRTIDCRGMDLTIVPKTFTPSFRHKLATKKSLVDWTPKILDLRHNPRLLILGSNSLSELNGMLEELRLPENMHHFSRNALTNIEKLEIITFENNSTPGNVISESSGAFEDVCCGLDLHVNTSKPIEGLTFCEMQTFKPGVDAIFEPFVQYVGANTLIELKNSSNFMAEAAESKEKCAEYCAVTADCNYFSYDARITEASHRCYLNRNNGTKSEKVCCDSEDYADIEKTLPGWTSGRPPQTRHKLDNAMVLFRPRTLVANKTNGYKTEYTVFLGSTPLRGAVWITPKLETSITSLDVKIWPPRVTLYDSTMTATVEVTILNANSLSRDETLVVTNVIESCDTAFTTNGNQAVYIDVNNPNANYNCPPETFRDGIFCKPCPLNAKCPMNTTIETLIVKSGFWRDSLKTSTLYECEFDACLGSKCQEGHKGPLCQVCTSSTEYFNHFIGECIDCPSSTRVFVTVTIIFAVIALLIALVQLAIRYSSSLRKRCNYIHSVLSDRVQLQTKIKLCVSFFQIIGNIQPVYGVKLDRNFTSWLNFLRSFNFAIFDLLGIPLECLGSMTYRLLINAIWPFGLTFMLVILVLFCTIFTHKGEVGGMELKTKIWSRSLYCAIIVFYLSLPSVSNKIFDAIKCQSFDTHDMEQLSTSYLIADWNIKCDSTDSEYTSLQVMFWTFFVIWPVMVPMIFFYLLWRIKQSVRSKRITVLAKACRFLWVDYHGSMMFWEILDIIRKISLTTLIIFIEPEKGGSDKIFRLIVAIAICTIYFFALAIHRPYQRRDDLYLSFISNMLLICFFLTGIVMHFCERDDGTCERYIGLSLNSFKATLVAVIITVIMLLSSILFMVLPAVEAISTPTVSLVSTNDKPNLQLPENYKFHMFLSHVWKTGKSRAQKIVRMLQLHMPGVKVWLDVDELKAMDQLEQSVLDSAIFVIFYSEGYFQSKNCRRELLAAFEAGKQAFVIYEGGANVIEKMKEECINVFTGNNPDSASILAYLLNEDPIMWLGDGSKYFYVESLKMVILRLLNHLPHYQRNCNLLIQGLKLEGELGPLGFSSSLSILFCDTNTGAQCVAEEICEESSCGDVYARDAIKMLHKTDVLQSLQERGKVYFILYLNENLFCNDNGECSKVVKFMMDNHIPVLLVHEQENSMGGCPFEKCFNLTPSEFVELPYKLYEKDVAVPLYSADEYRKVSLRLLLSKLGAASVCKTSKLAHNLRSTMRSSFRTIPSSSWSAMKTSFRSTLQSSSWSTMRSTLSINSNSNSFQGQEPRYREIFQSMSQKMSFKN